MQILSNQGRIEALARAMCVAAGNDPETKVVSAMCPQQRMAGRADYLLVPTGFEVMPAWRVWAADAEAALMHFQDAWTMMLDAQMFASYPGFKQEPQNLSSTNGQS